MAADGNPVLVLLGRAIASCSSAELAGEPSKSRGEATEIGMLETARALGIDVEVAAPRARRGASSTGSTRSSG